jgi:putative transposase
MAEIRVFRGGEFLCRAICQELAGETVGLKDILRARADRRRALRDTIKSRRSLVDQLLVRPTVTTPVLATAPAVAPALAGAPSLKRYRNE